MVADFDERAGDHRGRDRGVGRRRSSSTTRSACAGSTAPCSPASAGRCSTTATRRGAERRLPARARARPPPRQPAGDLPRPHRAGGRAPPRRPATDDAADAAVEALELHLAGGPRRLANRVDPRADVLTADRRVLHGPRLRRRRRRPSRAGRPAARARRRPARRGRGSGAAVPRRRRRLEPPKRPPRVLGPDGFAAAFGAVRTVDWALTWTSGSDRGPLTRRLGRVQRQCSVRSAALRMVVDSSPIPRSVHP